MECLGLDIIYLKCILVCGGGGWGQEGVLLDLGLCSFGNSWFYYDSVSWSGLHGEGIRDALHNLFHFFRPACKDFFVHTYIQFSSLRHA